MIKYIDKEKMVVHGQNFTRTIHHLKCCGNYMKEIPAYIGTEHSLYYLNGIVVEERHPQFFQCANCNKIMIRKFINIPALKLYFTAITDNPHKKLTINRLLELRGGK